VASSFKRILRDSLRTDIRADYAVYALAAMAFLALLLWRADALYSERAGTLATARIQAALASEAVAVQADQALDTADLLAEDVRGFVGARGGLATTSISALHDFMAQKIAATSGRDYMLVTSSSGLPLSLSTQRDLPLASLGDRTWFRAVKAGAPNYVGTIVKGRFGGTDFYTYSMPLIGSGGALEGAVNIAIRAQGVKGIAQRAPGMPLVQLWTSDGRLLVSNFIDFDAMGNVASIKAPFAHIPAARSGYLAGQGADAIVAYRKAEGWPLLATVTMSRRAVLASYDAHVRDSAIMLAAIGFAMALLAHLAARLAERDRARRDALQKTAEALSGALAQRDELLKEVHHRVKNSLQVTSSLMQLQSRQFEDEKVREAFARAQQRLRAIGMIHDALHQEDAETTVDMGRYIEQLTSEIAFMYEASDRGIRFSLDVDPIHMSAEKATPLALCASEVLVNAFEHAFGDSREGNVSVRMKRQEGAVALDISDDGKGFAGVPARDALGLRLISAFATQLKGKMSIDSRDGTRFRLEFPLASIAA
jgi:two-component sensor histidine kinase